MKKQGLKLGINRSDDETSEFLFDYHVSLNGLSDYKIWTGTDGAETIKGNSGKNALLGFAGDDVMKGRGGNDAFYGGKGDDILTGGKGGDAFQFRIGDGHDVVKDLHLSNQIDSDFFTIFGEGTINVSSAEQFLDEYATQKGNSVIIELNSHDSIEFKNTELSEFYQNIGNVCLWLP